MLRRGQVLNAMAASRRGSTRLEDELLPAMESFLELIDVIDQQLREAQVEQVAQFELERVPWMPTASSAGSSRIKGSTLSKLRFPSAVGLNVQASHRQTPRPAQAGAGQPTP